MFAAKKQINDNFFQQKILQYPVDFRHDIHDQKLCVHNLSASIAKRSQDRGCAQNVISLINLSSMDHLVIDNALSQTMCEEILNSSGFFPVSMGDDARIAQEINSYHYADDEQQCTFAPFMFWDGWGKSPADTPKKRAIKEIWEHRLPFPLEELCGIEYWTRSFTPGQWLAPHVDEDTFLYERTKKFSGPLIGSVYYGPQPSEIEEGEFVIYPIVIEDGSEHSLEESTLGVRVSSVTEKEIIQYQPNRLVIMDTGHQVHGTVPAKRGIRYVMVTNVWHVTNPPTALELNTFYYE